MKIDTLNFLNNLLLTHDEKLFHPYLDLITKVEIYFIKLIVCLFVCLFEINYSYFCEFVSKAGDSLHSG